MREKVLSILTPVFLAIPSASSADPKFSSGFNRSTCIDVVQGSRMYIMGTDSATGGDWSTLGKSGSAIPGLENNIYINTGDKNLAHAGAEIVTTYPASPASPALRLWVADNDPSSPWVTRSSVRFDYKYGSASSPDFAFQQCYIKFKMFIEPEYKNHIRSTGREWFQIFEIWDCGRKWKQPEMSIHLSVKKRDSAYHLDFGKRVKATNGKFTVLHRKENTSFDIPFGEWIDIELFYNPGFGNEVGRFIWKMNRTTIFDISEGDIIDGKPAVLNEGKPIMYILPFKIYQADALIDRMRAAGTVCQAWYDDFEYWDDWTVLETGTSALRRRR